MPLLAKVTRLGPYEVLSPLGAGGMGEVYKARDTRLGREVALKILPQALAEDPARRTRFETEAKAASALSHPGIVSVFDVGNENGFAYLVTEFVDGETLRERRPETLRQQLDVAAQIAEALAAAHAAGITHRDLKPENVMLTHDGRAKILDFGLARQAGGKPDDSTLTQEGAVLGTVGYMSPEQARGRTADYRSDIFSLGAVLYELFSGRRAFQGESAADTLSAILKQEPAELPAELPAGVRQIVQHCLEKDPERRFQSAKDLAFALRALSGSGVTSAPPVDLPIPKRSRSAIWWGVAAGVTAVVAGFAAHAWQFTPSNVDLASLRYTPVALNVYSTAAIPGPSWAPDGKSFVYVHDVSGRRQVFLQSLASPTPSQVTGGSLSPQFPLFSADSSRVYFLADEPYPREVWSISASGGTPDRILPSLGGSTGMDGIALSRDGKALVVAKVEDDGKLPMSVWISSPPGAKPTKYPGSPSGAIPWNRARLRFSPDGSTLLAMVFEKQSYELWLLPWPPSSGRGIRRILPQIQDWGAISSADWMRDGRHLVLSEARTRVSPGHLWMADLQTEKLSPISTADAQYVEPAVNPRDGRILVSQVHEFEDAVEIPLDGSALRDLVATSRRELYPAWSPIGDQFVYVTDRRGDEEIWLSSKKEGWQRPLVTQSDLPVLEPAGSKYQFVAPVWSPDGSRIAYSAGGGVWISSIAGGPATLLLANGLDPTWSPDGSWIGFVEREGNKGYLSKQKVGSSMPPVRISPAAGPFRPAWSPDGKWITIQLPEGLGLISPDGKEKKIIFRGNLGVGSACGWARDPSTLYLGYVKDQNLILSAFDVRTGVERKISNLGAARFSYFSGNALLLNEAPDGKSLAGSFLRADADIWMIEGVQPPPDFWHRLFGRPGRASMP